MLYTRPENSGVKHSYKEKNQARSCKKEKVSLGSGHVFGYLFLIKHYSDFVFFSLGSYNCGISNQLKTVKKNKGFPKRQCTANCFMLFISDISYGIQMVVID